MSLCKTQKKELYNIWKYMKTQQEHVYINYYFILLPKERMLVYEVN